MNRLRHFVARCAGHALDEQIVCLATARRKNDFGRVGIDCRRHLFSRALNRAPRQTTAFIGRRGIGELRRQERQHRLTHDGIDGRGRVVVKIERGTHGNDVGTE